MIKRYLNEDVEELSRDLSIEENDINGYHGREVLELLQNVDDAYELSVKAKTATSPVEAEISFIDGILKVSNTGTSFTFEGVKAIVLGHLSTKDETLIGNKGSGFRSVLNWSNDIKIYSGAYSVGFSRKYADLEYHKIKNYDSILKQEKMRKKRGKAPLSFPVFSMPYYINPKDTGMYTTTIELVIDNDRNKDDHNVISQLNEFDHRTLLFLPNLSRLTIKIENEKTVFSKSITKYGDLDKVTISKNNSNIEEFYVQKSSITEEKNNKHIIIAAPLKPLESYPIYGYFPTKQMFFLPVLVHAPFVLSQDRNRITTDSLGHNKMMVTKILNETISLAIKLTNVQEDREYPLFILTPNNIDNHNWGNTDVIRDFNLLDYYLNNITEACILPLRNGGFTKIVNGIKIFDIPTPHFFNGEGFELLLENIANIPSYLFVKKLLNRKGINTYFSSLELIKILNNIKLNLEESVETFIWWSGTYRSESYKSIPNIIKIDNTFITNNDERVFLPSQDGISDLPLSLKQHVKLKIISQDFVDLLIIKLKERSQWRDIKNQFINPSDKRILDKYSEEFLAIRLNEQSSREMIIREINNQVQTYEISIEFVKWLFGLYKKGDLTSQSVKEIAFNFPVNNYVRKSSDIYLGRHWDNPIAEYLFNNDKYVELVSSEILGIPESENQLFMNFITDFGVSKYPVFSIREVDYKGFKAAIGKTHAKHINSYSCDNFENLIKTLDTNVILDWIKNDDFLSAIIPSIEENSYAKLQKNSYQEKFKSNAYIIYILNEVKWIYINGEKYAPKDIVEYEKLSNTIKDFYGISRTNLRKLVGETLLNELCFRETFADFDDVQIYTLITKLSELSDKNIPPKLYDDIVRGKRDQKPIDSSYDTSKFNVLCKDGIYYKTDEVWYADKIVPRLYTNDPKNHFIQINPKLGTNTIYDWFGVKKFEVDLKYKSHSISENQEIIKDIDELKIALLASIDNNTNNIDTIKRLKIIPVSSLTVIDIYNNEIVIEDEYYHILSNHNVVYLKIPNKYDQLKIAPMLTDIFRHALVYNFDEKQIQLMILFNRNQKIEYVNSEYGTDKWSLTEKLLFNEMNSQKQIIEFFENKNLEDELLRMISKISFDTYIKKDQYEVLIKALRAIDCDINDLNALDIFPQIDIKPFWQHKIQEYLITSTNQYKSHIYLEFQNKEVKEQMKFISMIDKYTNFEYPFNNSIDVNIDEIIINKFGFKPDEINQCINTDEIYKKNYKELLCNTNTFNDFISDNENIKSLIYFINKDIKNYIIAEFEKTISNEDNVPFESGPIRETGRIVDNPIVAKEFKVLIKQKKGTYGKSKSRIDNENKQREVKGKQAEEKAYNLLLKKYPNLKWTSENAYSHLPERNTSTSNDMYYINSKNQKVLIEVKSSSGTFYMTSSEYNLAQSQGDLYEIWLVDLNENIVNGPKFIREFESSKESTEYRFSYIDATITNE
jgi:hypothetical protein